jgi:tight adherence protein B
LTGLAVGVLGGLAGILAAAAAREGVLASPRLLASFLQAVDPLVRAGREGHTPTALERRKLALLGTMALLAGGWLVAGWRLALILGVAGPATAAWTVTRRRDRFRQAAIRGLPALATAIADGLAAGRSLRGALGPAVVSVDGPVATEAARVVAELELGAATADAVDGLRQRLRSTGADGFAATLLSPGLGGGDMALLLRRYAAAASERDRLAQDARAATAQARFTGMLVVAMPSGGAVCGELIQPGFVSAVLTSPAAAMLLAAAAGLQILGFMAIRRLSAVPG